MTVLEKGLVTAIVVGALGAAVYEHTLIAGQRRQIDILKTQADGLRHQVREYTTAESRRAAATASAGLSANGGAIPNDPYSSEIELIYRNVAQLRKHLDQDPRQRIPELSYVTALDWIALATRHPKLNTEREMRSAMADARRTGVSEFGNSLEKALRDYLAVSQNQLPTDVFQLEPYFDPPVEPATLQRYEMLQGGNAAAFSGGPTAFGSFTGLIGSKLSAMPDLQYDYAYEFVPTGSRSQGAMEYAQSQAMTAYRAANHGQSPQDLSQLVPYFTNPQAAALFSSRFQALSPSVH